jgi:hypothetical protein
MPRNVSAPAPHRRARGAAAALAALFLLLAIGVGHAWADVGVGSFSVSAAAPGDHVRVTLQGCTAPATDVRISLGSGGAGGSLGTLHDVAITETTTTGTYAMVVPELEPGTYLLGAACPASGPFGFYGAELRITSMPATSTVDPARVEDTSPGLVGPLLALVWVLAAAAVAVYRRRVN